MTLRAAFLTASLALAALVAAVGPTFANDPAKEHTVIANVVAVDLQAKSIRAVIGTESQAFPVDGKAAESLDELPIGRTFKLTLQDGDDGTRRVVAIKRAKQPSKK